MISTQPVRKLVQKLRRSAFLTLVLLGFAGLQVSHAQQDAATRNNNSVEVPAAPSAANSASESDRPALQHRDDRYRLCASDVIALTFPLTPEFNQTVNIQPDGYASLTGAGDIRLQGLTTAQSLAAIREAYAKVLNNPIVTMELKNFNKPYFIVNGQVHSPGRYDLRGYTTATQAVAMAGGFEDSAKHSQVLVFRRVNNDWYEVKSVNLKHILQGHDVNEDPEIRTGDMLFVPQNFISKIKKFIPSTGVGTYYQLYQ
jgi:polysaccharide biosynthesis/export protein